MSLSAGIIGLPNVGKSTLFNALLSRQIAKVSPYPFCTIEPNVGVVEVPDGRLKVLAKIVGSSQIVPSVVKFIDIAGLVKGAHEGEGLGNKFLHHIRECSLIIHLLRAFDDPNVPQSGSVDPQSDYETVMVELCLADLETLEKQREATEAVLKLKKALGKGTPASGVDLSDQEKELAGPLNLLTMKPTIVVLNINESDLQGPALQKIAEGEAIPICAKLESDLAELNPEERTEYLQSMGVSESGLEKLIKKSFQKLGLVSFFSARPNEVRSWTIEKGTRAQEAAGVIHTDFEKGFIKALVCPFEEFAKSSGWKELRETGRARVEGKDYIVQEGDVIEFMFKT